MENDATEMLVREIRDLLIPIAAHYRAGYEEQLRIERQEKAARLSQMVRGKQARNACLMMDGTNEQGDIRRKIGIASGNLSPLISRLEQDGMLTGDSDRGKPRLIFSREELEQIFGEK